MPVGPIRRLPHTVIIMTCNIGSHHRLDGVTPHGEIKPEARTAEPDRAAT